MKSTENQNVEWKESWRDDYLKWICGFANAQGGKLELGRNDKGVLTGLNDAKRLLEDLPNKIRTTHKNIIVNDNDDNSDNIKGTERGQKGDRKGDRKGTENQRLILNGIAQNPHITINELASAVGISASKIKENIAKLKEKGLIERVGADKGGYWRLCNKPINEPINDTTNENSDNIKGTERGQKGDRKGDRKGTENQRLILNGIAQNPHITINELVSAVGISASKIKENIAKLKEKGLIERVGADKGGYWRLCDKPINEPINDTINENSDNVKGTEKGTERGQKRGQKKGTENI